MVKKTKWNIFGIIMIGLLLSLTGIAVYGNLTAGKGAEKIRAESDQFDDFVAMVERYTVLKNSHLKSLEQIDEMKKLREKIDAYVAKNPIYKEQWEKDR